mmetsp:Transcript_6943/g.14759  ORF Transcript_6943/g.14759 Transcript_6943/m.14759 type:complete len:358 (+) Transcript_6943:203-1276(+)
MAAILCQPVGNCCDFICSCRACKSLSCSNPLSAYVGITFLTQVPIVVVAAMEITNATTCKGSQWLAGMLAVSLAHVATSVYLSLRVANSTDEALRHKHSAWERISYLLCHDAWIAAYILVFLFYVAWLCVGSIWAVTGAFHFNSGTNDTCGPNVYDSNGVALGLGWFYLFAGPTVLSCNICCACCCNKHDYAADDEAFAALEAEKEANAAAKENNNNSNSNNNNNNNNYNADIETPHDPAELHVELKTTKPPITYSAEGIPVEDEYTSSSAAATAKISNVKVAHADAVVESNVLPPPMMPPQFQKHDNDVTTGSAPVQAKPPAKKNETQSGGFAAGWFGSKKKKDDDQLPDTEATIY